MGDFKLGPVAYKLIVKQEYEVYVYYPEGIICEDSLDIESIIEGDAVELAFDEEGLAVRLHDDSETSNGYVAFVETLEPEVDLVYSMATMPTIIERAIKEKNIQGLKLHGEDTIQDYD